MSSFSTDLDAEDLLGVNVEVAGLTLKAACRR